MNTQNCELYGEKDLSNFHIFLGKKNKKNNDIIINSKINLDLYNKYFDKLPVYRCLTNLDYFNNLELYKFLCLEYHNDDLKCSNIGDKISKSLVDNSISRIFEDPTFSIMELVSNSIDSIHKKKSPDEITKSIGKFGMGFFSFLFWVLKFENVSINIQSKFNITIFKQNGILKLQQNVINEPTYEGFKVELNCNNQLNEYLPQFERQIYKFKYNEDVKILLNNKMINIKINEAAKKGTINITINNLIISVYDDGIGMELEQLKALLTPSISTKMISRKIVRDNFNFEQYTEVEFQKQIDKFIKYEESGEGKFIISVADVVIIEEKIDTYENILLRFNLPYYISLPVGRNEILDDISDYIHLAFLKCFKYKNLDILQKSLEKLYFISSNKFLVENYLELFNSLVLKYDVIPITFKSKGFIDNLVNETDQNKLCVLKDSNNYLQLESKIKLFFESYTLGKYLFDDTSFKNKFLIFYEVDSTLETLNDIENLGYSNLLFIKKLDKYIIGSQLNKLNINLNYDEVNLKFDSPYLPINNIVKFYKMYILNEIPEDSDEYKINTFIEKLILDNNFQTLPSKYGSFFKTTNNKYYCLSIDFNNNFKLKNLYTEVYKTLEDNYRINDLSYFLNIAYISKSFDEFKNKYFGEFNIKDIDNPDIILNLNKFYNILLEQNKKLHFYYYIFPGDYYIKKESINFFINIYSIIIVYNYYFFTEINLFYANKLLIIYENYFTKILKKYYINSNYGEEIIIEVNLFEYGGETIEFYKNAFKLLHKIGDKKNKLLDFVISEIEFKLESNPLKFYTIKENMSIINLMLILEKINSDLIEILIKAIEISNKWYIFYIYIYNLFLIYTKVSYRKYSNEIIYTEYELSLYKYYDNKNIFDDNINYNKTQNITLINILNYIIKYFTKEEILIYIKNLFKYLGFETTEEFTKIIKNEGLKINHYLVHNVYYLFKISINEIIEIEAIDIKRELNFKLSELISYIFYNNFNTNNYESSFIDFLENKNKNNIIPLQIVKIAASAGTTKNIFESIITETIQNSIDSLIQKNIEKAIEIKLAKDKEFFVYEIKDYGGIKFNDIFPLFIPYLSSKTNDALTVGEMGNGFFNVYRMSKKVIIESVYENKKFTILDEPTYDKENIIEDINKTIIFDQDSQEDNYILIRVYIEPEKFNLNLEEIISYNYQFLSNNFIFTPKQIIVNDKNINLKLKFRLMSEHFDIKYCDKIIFISQVQTEYITFNELLVFIDKEKLINKNYYKLIKFGYLLSLKKESYIPNQSRTSVFLKEDYKQELQDLLLNMIFLVNIGNLYLNLNNSIYLDSKIIENLFSSSSITQVIPEINNLINFYSDSDLNNTIYKFFGNFKFNKINSLNEKILMLYNIINGDLQKFSKICETEDQYVINKYFEVIKKKNNFSKGYNIQNFGRFNEKYQEYSQLINIVSDFEIIQLNELNIYMSNTFLEYICKYYIIKKIKCNNFKTTIELDKTSKEISSQYLINFLQNFVNKAKKKILSEKITGSMPKLEVIQKNGNYLAAFNGNDIYVNFVSLYYELEQFNQYYESYFDEDLKLFIYNVFENLNGISNYIYNTIIHELVHVIRKNKHKNAGSHSEGIFFGKMITFNQTVLELQKILKPKVLLLEE